MGLCRALRLNEFLSKLKHLQKRLPYVVPLLLPSIKPLAQTWRLERDRELEKEEEREEGERTRETDGKSERRWVKGQRESKSARKGAKKRERARKTEIASERARMQESSHDLSTFINAHSTLALINVTEQHQRDYNYRERGYELWIRQRITTPTTAEQSVCTTIKHVTSCEGRRLLED